MFCSTSVWSKYENELVKKQQHGHRIYYCITRYISCQAIVPTMNFKSCDIIWFFSLFLLPHKLIPVCWSSALPRSIFHPAPCIAINSSFFSFIVFGSQGEKKDLNNIWGLNSEDCWKILTIDINLCSMFHKFAWWQWKWHMYSFFTRIMSDEYL